MKGRVKKRMYMIGSAVHVKKRMYIIGSACQEEKGNKRKSKEENVYDRKCMSRRERK